MSRSDKAAGFLDSRQAEDSIRAVEPRSNSLPWSLRLLLAAIVLAVTSRLLVPLGVPRIVDFLHFPFVLAALMSLKLSRLPRPARSSLRWLAVLFVGGLASTIAGFGFDFVRPIAGWILLAEPLLAAVVVMAGVRQTADPSHAILFLTRTILLLAALQGLFGLVQVLAGRRTDQVQGTFLEMGAGAHVASAVMFIAVIVVVAEFIHGRSRGGVLRVVITLLASLALTIRADANQVFVAALPALGSLWAISVFRPKDPTTSSHGRVGSLRTRRLLIGIVAAILALATYLLYPPLQRLGDSDYLGAGAASKIDTVLVVAREMQEQPHSIILGLGPASTVSRFALLTEGGAVRSDSPLRFLEIEVAPITNRIRQLTASDYIGSSSSVWSGFASFTGLVGDLGLVGLVAYVMAWLSVARPSISARSWESAAAIGALVFVAILGLMYLWWEEPGVMLLVGCLVGIGASRDEESRLIEYAS